MQIYKAPMSKTESEALVVDDWIFSAVIFDDAESCLHVGSNVLSE